MDDIKAISDFGFRMADLGLTEAGPANPQAAIRHPQSGSVERAGEQAERLAKDFESILLTRLFNQVQESLGDWGFDEEDGTSSQVQGLFWFYLAHDVADKGGFGLWKDIYRHIEQREGIEALGESVSEEL